MNLTNKSQTDIDIQAIEDATNTFVNALNAAIFTLNLAYDALWKLPDDRLVAVLQRLYETNTMMELFDDHNFSAVNLNEIQDRTHESGPKAAAILGREFIINSEGIVSLVYPPEPEVIIEPDTAIQDQITDAVTVEEIPSEVTPPQDELP